MVAKKLETLIDELPRDSAWAAESMTLASGIMGMRIGLEGSLGMSLGAKSGRLLARAARLSPDNPRVHLQQGISSFNTPEMWGGDKKEAETELRQAVALFAGQSDETKWPNWGYMEALAWLGQTPRCSRKA